MFSMLENMRGPPALLLGGILIALVYLLGRRFATEAQRRKLIASHGCKPPQKFPVRDPLFGLDVMYQTVKAHANKTMLQTKRSHHEMYGNTHSSRLATVRTISTIDPENIKAVLSTNFKDFHVGLPRRRAFSPAIANSILVADGAEWERSRAFLRPSFSRSQVGDLQTLETHVKHLLESIPRDGSTLDLADRFFRYTADVTTDLMFGESILSLPHPEAFGGDLSTACRDLQVGGERRFILGKFADVVPQREFYRSVKKVHDWMDSHVEKAIQQRRLVQEKAEKEDIEDESSRHIFLKELVKLTDDRLTLRDQLLGMFLAGRDTTASLLSNLFFVLARYPEVWQRLHEEIRASLQGRRPTYDELKKLKYLSYCLNETLRLYPVVIGTSRVAMADVILPTGGGADKQSPIFVREGTLVSMHFHALHRRPDLWGPDASEFRPERWADEREITPWMFLPFGGGPRVCIGQQLALTSATYTAVRLLQDFAGSESETTPQTKIEARDSRPWTENIGATCTSEFGVLVGFMEA